MEKAREAFVSVIYTPVVFYGRVVDQDGNSVQDADVSVSVSDKVGGGGSKLTMKTNTVGEFTVDTKGMSIYVSVSKHGYYLFPPREEGAQFSKGGFDYGQDFGRGVHNPDRSLPVVFTLYKAEPPANLIRIPKVTVKLARTGEPKTVPLASRDGVTGKSVVLRCWTHDDRQLPDGRYDWRFEISTPNGQLQSRLDDFAFTAPEAGYSDTQTIEMPLTLLRPDWHDSTTISSWLKFSDGTFARVKVRMVAFGDHFAAIEGYLNPSTGSRNLEADPKQR